MATKTTTHRTGYYVWIFGDRSWHRTRDGAERRAIEAQSYCANVQVIECASGALVSGRPE